MSVETTGRVSGWRHGTALPETSPPGEGMTWLPGPAVSCWWPLHVRALAVAPPASAVGEPPSGIDHNIGVELLERGDHVVPLGSGVDEESPPVGGLDDGGV